MAKATLKQLTDTLEKAAKLADDLEIPYVAIGTRSYVEALTPAPVEDAEPVEAPTDGEDD